MHLMLVIIIDDLDLVWQIYSMYISEMDGENCMWGYTTGKGRILYVHDMTFFLRERETSITLDIQ